MKHNLIHALIGWRKCPRYYILNVPEKRFRADRGKGGMGRMEDVKGGMGVEGRDGKYGIGREGWDEIGREGLDGFGREG